MQVAALIGENKTKGQFVSCSRQLVTGGHQAGLDVLGAKNLRNFTNHVQTCVPTAGGCLLENWRAELCHCKEFAPIATLESIVFIAQQCL